MKNARLTTRVTDAFTPIEVQLLLGACRAESAILDGQAVEPSIWLDSHGAGEHLQAAGNLQRWGHLEPISRPSTNPKPETLAGRYGWRATVGGHAALYEHQRRQREPEPGGTPPPVPRETAGGGVPA